MRQFHAEISARTFHFRHHPHFRRYPDRHPCMSSDCLGSGRQLGRRRVEPARILDADGSGTCHRRDLGRRPIDKKRHQQPCIQAQDTGHSHRLGHSHIGRGMLAQLGLRSDSGRHLRQGDSQKNARRRLPSAHSFGLQRLCGVARRHLRINSFENGFRPQRSGESHQRSHHIYNTRHTHHTRPA